MVNPEIGNGFFCVRALTALWKAHSTSVKAFRVGMCDNWTF
jgi:hypothetical protein